MKCFAACLSFVLAAFAAAACHAEEPVPDFGFESATDDGRVPTKWRANNDQSIEKIEVVEAGPFVRSGKRAVRITHAGERPGHLYSNVPVPVKAGETYTASFWAKGSGRVGAALYLYRLNDAGQEAFHATVGVTPEKATATDGQVPDDGQWHEYRYTLKLADAKARTARMVIVVSGNVALDDAHFALAKAAAAAAAKKAGADADGTESAVRPNLLTLGLAGPSPTVDGVIGDDEYAVQGSGMLNNELQDVYRLDNAYFFSRDKERLYFALRLRLPDGYKLAAAATERDNRALIVAKDTLYLFVRPDSNTSLKAFEGAYLAIASNGTVFDAWEKVDWQNPFCDRDASFNADVHAKTASGADGIWTAEVSVPLKDLRLPRASNGESTILISFGMNLQGTAVVWQARPNWFDHYQGFGQLRLSDVAVTASMPTAGSLARGQLAPTVRLSNPGTDAVPYELTYLVSTPRMVGGGIGSYVFDQAIDVSNKDVVRDQAIFQWNPAGQLAAGQTAEQTTASKLDKTGSYVLEMEARAGGRAVAYQKIPFRHSPPVVGQMTPVPSKELIKTSISLAGAAPEERGTVRVDFRPAAGGQPVLSQRFDAGRDEIEQAISMAELQPGDYLVDFVLLTATGNEVATSTTPFKKWETPIWLKERAGIDALEPDWVPAPWTKVQQAADRVAVWGREFRFGDSSLLADITSQGQSLLTAGGAVIKYAIDGKQHAIKVSAPQFPSVHDGRVEVTQSGDSPHFALTVRQTIEFDGMNRIDLSIAPKAGPANVEKVWLELPYRPDLRFTAFTDLDGRFWQHGTADDAFFDHSRGYRWFWVGNDDVGCAFFADNYKGWIVNSKKPRVTLTRGGDSRTFELRFVNEPSDVAGPMEITFGLQPTPFKQPFDGWREMRPHGLLMAPPPANLVMPHASLWNSTDSKPSPRNWKMLDDMLAFLHGRGQKVYPYMGAFFISPYDNISPEFGFDPTQSPIPPEFRQMKKETATRQEEYFYFGEDWLGTPRSIIESPTWETRQEVRVSPSSSWTDYFVHGIAEMLKRSTLDGVYLDIQQPMISFSTEKGHVHVTKDGVREGTAEMFATRDFYKRMYRVFEQNRTNEQRPWMLGHGFAINAPFSSFWDFNFNGEEIKPTHKFGATRLTMQASMVGTPLAQLPADPSATPDYSGDGFRSVFGGQFGVPSMYLPQYGYLPELKVPEHSREMLSITFVHNNMLWPAYIPDAPVVEFWNKVEVPFGMGDTEFHGYWENDLRTSAEYIKASYWKKLGREEYLLAVANWSGEPVEATVTLPASLATLKQRIEMEGMTEMARETATLKVSIPAHDLKVIRLK